MKVLIESARDGWLDNKNPYVSKLVDKKYHVVIEDGKSYIYIHDIDEIFKLINVIGWNILICSHISTRFEYNLSDNEKESVFAYKLLIYDDYLE